MLNTMPQKEETSQKLSLHHSVVVAELEGGWVVLGELSKYVTLSPQRFVSITVASHPHQDLKFEVAGKVGESVKVLMRKPSAQLLTEVALVIGPDGKGRATVQQ